MPALYLALDPMTAIKEANQGFAHKIEPCVMCAYEVDCEDIVDLRTEEGRIAAETSEEVLAAGWYSCLALGKSPPQWGLVAYLRSQGAAGALAPSYASGASATDSNLVLWKWGPECPHKVLVFDPSGKRPKNQLSWR